MMRNVAISTVLMMLALSGALVAQESDPAALASWETALWNFGQDKPPPEQPPKQPAPPGQQSPVEKRDMMKEEQQPAPRPGLMTLDPKYIGFIPVPGTPVLIKFNAKPRVDLTMDNRNAGDDNRFITAKIPVSTDPTHGGGHIFNINAKASQLSIDVRAPDVIGTPRFFYQNDFFGAGPGEFPFRIKHLYGQVYNIVVGMTFSVFEDPDVWPDTVDFEGPNSMIFARRPLARYMLPLSDSFYLNFGLEQPESEIDTSIDPTAAGVNHSPDVGVNGRWEDKDVGHVQLAAMFRRLGVRGPLVGNQRTFGWGINLSGGFNLWGKDTMQLQGTYGEGIFRYINDDFFNNDAAFDRDGDLKPIPYVGFMFGYTHHWSDEYRSTISYGYTHLSNEFSQAATAYHVTHYASVNVIWQIKQRLQLGLEALYGSKEDNDDHRGNVVRVQFGLLYSLFD